MLFMQKLWKVIQDSEMLGSKKFRAFIVGLVILILQETGLDVSPEFVTNVLYLVGGYMTVQGIADIGKEGKKALADRLNMLRKDG